MQEHCASKGRLRRGDQVMKYRYVSSHFCSYLDYPGVKVQMSVKQRRGKGSFISEGF